MILFLPQEDQVYKMGPLIDAELEAVDRRHAQLTRLSTELVDALNLYHQLMHENIQGGYGHMQLPPGGKICIYIKSWYIVSYFFFK